MINHGVRLNHKLHLLYMIAVGVWLQLQAWIGRYFVRSAASGELPFSRDHITPAWVESAVQATCPGAAVERVIIDDVQEGTTSHNTLRLIGCSGDANSPLPETLFYKSPERWKSRLAVGTAGLIKVEHNFFKLAAPHLKELKCRSVYTQAMPLPVSMARS